MSRGLWLGVGAAVLVGGVALAATGVVPNPFLPPPPEVVESGSDEAREAGEVRMPDPASETDPFAPAVPVVESGTEAARDLVGEEIIELGPLHDPFELPPVPIVESGTDEAWVAHGEEITDVEAIRRLAATRREAEAAFRANSRFPPNPESELGLYRFDLRIRQLIDSTEGLEEITYFVNSADNSMLFPDWGLANWLPIDAFAQGKLDFVIRQADGDLLACGEHRDFGPACVVLGENLGAAAGWLRNMTLHTRFLDSIASTPQTLAEGPGGAVQGLRGRGQDAFLQMWVSRHASPIATQMPYLGLGVGLMKDSRIRANRLVKRLVIEGGDVDVGDLVFDLIELVPARSEQDTSLYHFVTAFTAQGVEEAVQIGQQGLSLQAEARGIQEALDACPKGRDGRVCRERERARMKALEDQFRQQALDYGRRHGLPVED